MVPSVQSLGSLGSRRSGHLPSVFPGDRRGIHCPQSCQSSALTGVEFLAHMGCWGDAESPQELGFRSWS